MVYKGALLRTLQGGIENVSPQIKNLFKLLRIILGSFLRVYTVSHAQ